MRPEGAGLVGSIPLAGSEDVFRAVASALGGHVRRIPDGETGRRTNWIAWQNQFFADNPGLVLEEPDPDHYAPLPVHKLADRSAADSLDFPGGIGYAGVAKESYATFARLKDEGAIAPGVRFQVCLPTPLAPITQFVARDDQPAVEPRYELAMLAEVQEMCAAIPADQLAIQWDVAVEIAMWERVGNQFTNWFEDVDGEIMARLARLGEAIPADIELGYHLCYGDYGHQHFVQPTDAAVLTAVANALASGVGRPIAWIHMPVPRDRDDAAFFAPLAGLALADDTELYLGLVHYTDGEEGAQRRIAAAQGAVERFGVATECGFGRRPPETVADLLALHAAVADPVG